MSARDGNALTAAKLDDVKKNESSVNFLTKVGKDFWQDVRRLLDSMMDYRNRMSGGELRDGYSKTVRETIIVSQDIMRIRMKKLGEMALEEQFHQSKADLCQATPEEMSFFNTVTYAINIFRTKGGSS